MRFQQYSVIDYNTDSLTFYRDQTQVQLRLATGRDDLALPDWATAIMDDFDRALPRAVKNLLMLEGSVVLTKGD